MDNDNNPQSVWNFDEARMRCLNFKMALCEDAFEKWDYDNINLYLQSIKRVISGALTETDFDTLMEDYSTLEIFKRECDDNDKKGALEFYKQADEIYIKLNRLMQKLGFFFRKGNDVKFAALRR